MNKLEIHGRSVQIITWIFGLSCIEYPIGRQRPVISFFYLTFLIGILSYNINYIINHAAFSISDSTFSEKLFTLLFFLNIGILYYILGSEESKCLRQLYEVAESIAPISSDPDLKDVKSNKMIQIIFWITSVIHIVHFSIIDALDTETLSSNLLQYHTIYYVTFQKLAILYINIIFVNYLRIIQLNFAKLNKRLKELIAITDCSSSMSVYEIIKTISRIKQLHVRLTRVSTSFNNLYGIYVLLSITLKFGTMIFSLYTVYCSLYNIQSNSKTLIYTVISYCMSISLDLYIVIIVINACRLTTMEANKTGCIIFELSNNGSSMEIDNEIERFSVQLLQSPLEFTAHDFFVLNRGIIFDIVMMLITYLIVLLQLSTYEV